MRADRLASARRRLVSMSRWVMRAVARVRTIESVV